MAHFLAMGGYAAFVWPSYALSVLGIGAMIALTLRDYRRAKRRLAVIESEGKAKVEEHC
ncbi:MAG: heme exporter protein CcmD [Rhizomicrobium sp.]